MRKICSHCGEPTGAGAPSVPCPFGTVDACALAVDEESDPAVDPLGRTVAFQVTPTRVEGGDGFPVEDDLAERLLAQYRLGPRIGNGTMGRVYRAEHVGLKRPCAIKVMNPSLVEREPLTVEQFWAEARAAAGLIHPHVVAVHNLGTDRGYHFIEMELVEHQEPFWREVREENGAYVREYVPGGVSLNEKVVREGPLEPREAVQQVRQVSLGLAAAHRAGLVHRDVKPANVLLTADGQAKLADFGLVRRATEATGHGPLAGTPTFMAPELFLGAPASPSTDLYAVGVMLYYLLSARLPHNSERITRLVKRKVTTAPPDVRTVASDVPEELSAVVQRLLAPRPDDRYDSADALAHDLRVVLGSLRDTASLIEEAVGGLGGFLQHGDPDRFRLVIPVPGNRLQEVYLETHVGDERERLLSVFSVCGPADASHFEYALRLNADLTHGSLSIHELHGQPMFVMTKTFYRSHVSPEEIRAAVVEIARHSDRIEQRLTFTDLF